MMMLMLFYKLFWHCFGTNGVRTRGRELKGGGIWQRISLLRDQLSLSSLSLSLPPSLSRVKATHRRGKGGEGEGEAGIEPE